MSNEIEVTSARDRRMEEAGATREASYAALVRGLTAKKMSLDKYGIEHYEDDTASQIRSGEIILKMRGEIRADNVVENKTININVGKADLTPLLTMVGDVKEQLERIKIEGHQTGEILDAEYTVGN